MVFYASFIHLFRLCYLEPARFRISKKAGANSAADM